MTGIYVKLILEFKRKISSNLSQKSLKFFSGTPCRMIILSNLNDGFVGLNVRLCLFHLPASHDPKGNSILQYWFHEINIKVLAAN